MTTTTDLARQDPGAITELALIQGDLSQLTSAQRATYYLGVCHSLHLNPYTKPFEYLALKGDNGEPKLVLYTRKDCTDQLRGINGVSITKLERARMDGLYVVTAYAVDRHGRTDSAIGAVPISKEGGYWDTVKGQDGRPLMGDNGKPRRRFVADGSVTTISGEALANAIMKAETKAKRRVTLSLCGLGMTDESELDGIPNAQVVSSDLDESPREAWLRVTGEAAELGIDHKPLPDDAPDTKIRRWTAALQSRVTAARDAQPSPPTAAEKAAPRDTETGEVLDDTPGEIAPAPAPTTKRTYDEIFEPEPAATDDRPGRLQSLLAMAKRRGLQGAPPPAVGAPGPSSLDEAIAYWDARITNHDLDLEAAKSQEKALA
jgi:hypothetical protein